MKIEFILKIFEGFSIERWNDLIRPFEVIEMDKHAEKLFVAYIIAKYEENRGVKINWQWLIYASLFDLLRKIQLCDIKAPVQSLIRSQYYEEYKNLNDWVLDSYKDLIDNKDLYSKFEDYIKKLNGEKKLDESVNEVFRYENIVKELNADLQKYLDLRGLQLLITHQKPFEFLLRIEQLRFQTRWNQTPRIPKTSVLGHCFFVAILTLLFQQESGIKMCEKRMYNNFFSALFHDLPESVTRDIISPVKTATDGLPNIVKHIEEQIVAKELVPLMEDFYRNEILYFTNNEFMNRIELDNKVSEVSFEKMNENYNFDEFNPVDGRLVRVADHFSALLEAELSIRYGISSTQLVLGKQNLLNAYPEGKIINGLDVHDLFNSLFK